MEFLAAGGKALTIELAAVLVSSEILCQRMGRSVMAYVI